MNIYVSCRHFSLIFLRFCVLRTSKLLQHFKFPQKQFHETCIIHSTHEIFKYISGHLLTDMLVGGWVCHAAGAVPLLLTCGASNLFTFTYAIDASDSDHLHWPIDFLQVALSHEGDFFSIEDSVIPII